MQGLSDEFSPNARAPPVAASSGQQTNPSGGFAPTGQETTDGNLA